MPEGDTIYKTARRLHQAAVGQKVTYFAAWKPKLDRADLVGSELTYVESRGKHMLMHFDAGPALHTHMRMRGKWFATPTGERRRGVGDSQRIVLQMESVQLSCVNVQFARWVDLGHLPADDWLRKLGPDLLSPAFEISDAVTRLSSLGSLPLGEALMHQGALCGIGNVYKSETLFLTNLNPFESVQAVSATTLTELVLLSRKLMRLNLARGERQTRFRSGGGPGLWVYRRQGEHCLKCDTTIHMARQGNLQRSTYFCPSCQGVRAVP